MPRIFDPAQRQQERLRLLEQRAAAQREARAVADGVSETVELSEARGAAFEQDAARSGRREALYRRRTGLDWLISKGRITDSQWAAGQRYGTVWRRVASSDAIASTLDVRMGGGAVGGPPLDAILARAEVSAHAAARLESFRRAVAAQATMVRALDLVCGRELTPREATQNEREAGKLEAVLVVALDILASSGPHGR